MKPLKLLRVADVRERMDAHYRGEISYSRAVELLNEDANKALDKNDLRDNSLLSKARQMRLEQKHKIDSYTEHYNQYEIGTLNGIDRIVKLIERNINPSEKQTPPSN